MSIDPIIISSTFKFELKVVLRFEQEVIIGIKILTAVTVNIILMTTPSN